jgi:hypothetical protein
MRTGLVGQGELLFGLFWAEAPVNTAQAAMKSEAKRNDLRHIKWTPTCKKPLAAPLAGVV